MIVTVIILGFLGVSTLVLASYIKKNAVHIPPNHQSVLYSGNNSRVLRSGWYLIKWPKERLSLIDWSCREEDSDGNIFTRTRRSNFIPIHKQQLDVCTTQAMTKNRVTVGVNGTLHFRIENVMQVVQGPPNLLGDLTDHVESACRIAISKIDHKGLIGRDDFICSCILQHINEKLKDSGVVCTGYLLQNIEMNESLVKLEETRLIEERKADLESVRIDRDLEILKRKEEAQTERKQFLVSEKKKRSLTQILSDAEIHERESEAAMKKQKRDNDRNMQITLMNNKRLHQEASCKRERELAEQKYGFKKNQALLDHDMGALKKELEIEKLKVQKLMLTDTEKNKLEIIKKQSLVAMGYTPQLLTAQKIAPHLVKTMQGVERVIIMDGKNSTEKVGSLPWNFAMGGMFPDFKPTLTQHNYQSSSNVNNNSNSNSSSSNCNN